MRKMEEVDIFIRDYFNGKLSEEEIQSFQDQYDNNPDFKQLADQIEVEILGIRSHGREQLKSKFESWEKDVNHSNADKGVSTFPYLKISIAASFILAILYLGKMFLPTGKEDFFLAYYEPYENFEYTSTREEVESSSDKHKAYAAYDAKNYANAAQFFDKVISANPSDVPAIFFRGLCQMEMQFYEKGLNDLGAVVESDDPYYSEAALWYMSLIEVKLDHQDNATQYLEKLRSSKDYQVKAQELLEKLN